MNAGSFFLYNSNSAHHRVRMHLVRESGIEPQSQLRSVVRRLIRKSIIRRRRVVR